MLGKRNAEWRWWDAMKTLGEQSHVACLEEWLAQDTWRGSLAVGTTCGCDVARLGQDIRDYLNANAVPGEGMLMAFDREDIRRLAGDPAWRRKILSAVAPEGGCDYERMIRAVASLGGAVLSGQCSMDATRGLDNVFRVMVSSGGLCRGDDPSMRLDPARFSMESLVHVIGDSFADWCRGLPAETAGSAPAARRKALSGLMPAGA